jgi:hypothetical protein
MTYARRSSTSSARSGRRQTGTYGASRSQGVEVTHEAVNTVLSGLATSGRITLSLAAGDGPPPGGAVIHDIEDVLCE